MKTKQLRLMGISRINVGDYNLVCMHVTDYYKGCSTGEYYFDKDTYKANETIRPHYRLTYEFSTCNGKPQLATMKGTTLLEAFTELEEFKRKHQPLIHKRYWK